MEMRLMLIPRKFMAATADKSATAMPKAYA